MGSELINLKFEEVRNTDNLTEATELKKEPKKHNET